MNQDKEAVIENAKFLAEAIAPDDVCYHDARIPWDKVYGNTTTREKLERLVELDYILTSIEEEDERREFYEEHVKPAFVHEFYRNCCSPRECRICNDPLVSCYHETWGIGDICPSTTRGSP